MTGRFVDHLNIALIAATCLAAHLFPYHLLILSYAVLGPAHYLTQISWLHDRRYFSPRAWVLPVFTGLVVLLLLFPSQAVPLVTLALVVSMVAVAEGKRQRWVAFGMGVLLIGVLTRYTGVGLFVALMVPTVLHVFLFTACFMWVGALKAKRPSAWVALGALCVGAASFLLPEGGAVKPMLGGLSFFDELVRYLQSLSPLSAAREGQLFGFLSFAYTYHYLNWFSKAEVIRWHQIPRQRLLAILVLYAGALALYAYDYRTGFMVLLFLSLLHVLLELPLNLRTFATLGKTYFRY